MLKLSDEKQKRSFEERLLEYDIPKDAFKVLTFFFRQTVMQSKWARYLYQHETIIKEAGGDLRPEQRLDLACRYIREWEKRVSDLCETKVEYGFEAIEVSTLKNHLTLLSELDGLNTELASLKRLAPTLVDDPLLAKIENEAKKRFVSLIKKDGQLNHYLKKVDGKIGISEENFHYFSRYIGLSYGVFREFFILRQGAQGTESSRATETLFYKFLQDRFRHEHQFLPRIASYFSYSRIRDRVRNTAIKDKYSAIPYKICLIDSKFIDHLSQLNDIRAVAS